MASKPKRITRKTGVTELRWGKPQRTISLGRKRPDSELSVWHQHLKHLVAVAAENTPIGAESKAWLATLSDVDHGKLSNHGLVEARDKLRADRLHGLCDEWLDSRDVKDSSREIYARAIQNLRRCFPRNPYVARMTADDGNRFWNYLLEHGSLKDGGPIATTTATKRISTARDIFSRAVKRGLLETNPFSKQRGWKFATTNEENKIEVRAEWIAAALEACPDPEFRLIIVLARYAGFRIPSEPLELRWSDIIWDRNRMILGEAKTKQRTVPLFPEVARALTELYDTLGQSAEDWVIVRHRGKTGTAWRNQLERVLRRAGVIQWPRLWHNMRLTRESELLREYEPHTVCDWLGNSLKVALEHYARPLDADFTRAATPAQNQKAHPESTPIFGAPKTHTYFEKGTPKRHTQS